MKKLWITRLLLLFLVPVFIFSCGSDDEEAGPVVLLPKTDGFYVYGTNTIASGPADAAARMSLAALDAGKAPKEATHPNVFGKFMYIGANSKINFAEVTGGAGKVYGSADASVGNGAELGYSVNDNVVHGTLKEGAADISVATEGLYYSFVNLNTGLFILMPVKANMIGDATPLDWAAGTMLPLKSTSKDETVFEGTNIKLLNEHGYRYRLNDGWHVYFEENVLHTFSSLGVAEPWVDAIAKPKNDIGFFVENAPHKVTALYTVRLKYTASTGIWSEEKVKTGDVVIDYSAVNMGILGDATEGGNFNGDGTAFGKKTPTKAGNIFTWTWTNVSFIKDKQFIFLKDGTWGQEPLVDYTGATVSGGSITDGDIIDATKEPASLEYHNFYIINEGAYDVTLSIDGVTNAKTVTINDHK